MKNKKGSFPKDEWQEHDSMMLDIYKDFCIEWTRSITNEQMEQEFVYSPCLIHNNTSLPLNTFPELEEFNSLLYMYSGGRLPVGFEYRDHGIVIYNHGQKLTVSFVYNVHSYYANEWSVEKKQLIEKDAYADDKKTSKKRIIELGASEAFKLSARLNHKLFHLQQLKTMSKQYHADLQNIYDSLNYDPIELEM